MRLRGLPKHRRLLFLTDAGGSIGPFEGLQYFCGDGTDSRQLVERTGRSLQVGSHGSVVIGEWVQVPRSLKLHPGGTRAKQSINVGLPRRGVPDSDGGGLVCSERIGRPGDEFFHAPIDGLSREVLGGRPRQALRDPQRFDPEAGGERIGRNFGTELRSVHEASVRARLMTRSGAES